MFFNSYIFIFVFMPITMLLYFLIGYIGNRTISNIILLVASIIFIFYGFNYLGLISILISIAFNYCIYKLMSWDKLSKCKKLVLFVGIAVNVSALIYLKYHNTFIYHIDKIRNLDFVETSIILPLGISFYTFQQISFLVDAYRGEVPKCTLLDYSLYVSYFPRIISGPIIGHDIFFPKIRDNNRLRFQWDNFNKGIYRFSVGLSKKVLIADILSAPATAVFTNPENYYALNTLLGVLSYTLEIYFDFSGYSDMAIGVSKMLNIDIPENFDSPYKAANIKAFWGGGTYPSLAF